ncbi:MAG TPA: hypothetical protein VGN72_06505 [Tepidisphaeraceae bacterium]|jgi:hypothetical protein|nr:hypothetical protein [Tepidisphaeraceae bacterium]
MSDENSYLPDWGRSTTETEISLMQQCCTIQPGNGYQIVPADRLAYNPLTAKGDTSNRLLIIRHGNMVAVMLEDSESFKIAEAHPRDALLMILGGQMWLVPPNSGKVIHKGESMTVVEWSTLPAVFPPDSTPDGINHQSSPPDA